MTKEKLDKILDASDTICGECNGTEYDCEKCFVRAICDDVLGRNQPKKEQSYCVTLSVTGYYTAHVTAKSEEEAINLASDIYVKQLNPKLENTVVILNKVIKEES